MAVKHGVHVDFGQAAAVADDVFKLGEETAQRRAVVFHRFADAGDVGFGFAGFEQRGRVDAFDKAHAFGQAHKRADGGFVRFDKQRAADLREFVGNLGIRFDRDACGLQRGGGFGVQTALFGKQDGVVFANQQEGHENRVERHVAAAQVGQPGDVVKRGNQVVIRAFFRHHGAHAGEFFGGGFGDVGGVVDEHGFGRNGRAACPHLVKQIVWVFDADVFGGERLRQSAFAGERDHIGRDADGGVFGQVCREPFVIRRHLPAFLQFDAAARKLLGGLFPIAAVHPYARFVGGNDECADRAGKAR
ncbi:Uncharacterised protein [Neisseria meningitidis]|nr:Uncharacterised protein [Neisseria meningitidis]